jgi:hypothetical protein
VYSRTAPRVGAVFHSLQAFNHRVKSRTPVTPLCTPRGVTLNPLQRIEIDASITNLTALGSRWTRLLYTPEGFAHIEPIATSWTAGGCWLLARAAQRWSNHALELYVTVRDTGITDHVIAGNGAIFLDGDGLASHAELLKNMRVLEHVNAVRIEPLERIGALPGEICQDEARALRIANWLEQALPWEDARKEWRRMTERM